MSGSRQISPISAGWAAAVAAGFWAGAAFGGAGLAGAGLAAPVVFGAAGAGAGAAVLGAAPGAPFGAPLAMLLAGLDGIGGPTRVQVSPPHRNPSTQPWISSWSVPTGLIVEL